MTRKERPTVLVIDGMSGHAGGIEEAFVQAGMEVLRACGDQEGLDLFFSAQPDVVLLGTAMPVLAPWEVCRRIRGVSSVPIIVLADRASEAELLHAFNLGADEYLASTTHPALLVARTEALLRRAPRQVRQLARRVIQAGDIHIDLLSRQARLRGNLLPLSAKKFDLLAYLACHVGEVVTHRELARQIWGSEQATKMACLAVYVRHLRCCIEEDPHRPKRILTVRGIGYRLVANPVGSPSLRPGLTRRRQARAPGDTS